MINRLLPGKFGFLLTVSLLILQIALSPILIGVEVPGYFLAVVGCIISPFLQFNLVLHMGIVQFAVHNDLNFANLTLEVFPDITLLKILYIAIGMAVFYAVLILYFWPYKIETDPDNPLSWYYPCTPSFWRKKEDSQVDTVYQALDKDDKE